MKETRDLKITFTKGGSGSESTKLSLPVKWIRQLGLSKDNRDVEVTLDGNKIIIKKK